MIDISLIKNWHEKAKEDYFSRYVFEYLAFEAFLKNYKYSEEEIFSTCGNVKERSYIQKFKNESNYRDGWQKLIADNAQFKKTIGELVLLLRKEPLKAGNWWGCAEYEYSSCANNDNSGVVENEGDFINMVEFWYQVRNNLFHGGKNPDNSRDEILVKYAYRSLAIFFEKVLMREMEGKTIHPAVWEDFEHRFFKGEAEVMIKIGGNDACANVYELVSLDEKFFPLILNGQKIERDYVVDQLSFHLTNLCGDPYLLKRAWDRILRAANSPEKKNNLKIYFEDIIPLLTDMIGDLDI